MSFKYSIHYSAFGLVGLKPLEEPEGIFKVLKECGYNGVDVPGLPDQVDVRKVKEALDSYDLHAYSVLSMWDPTRDLCYPSETLNRNAVDYVKKCIDMMDVLDAATLCISPASHKRVRFLEVPVEKLRSTFVRSAGQILEYASDHNREVLVEPYNRYEGYQGFLNTVADAVKVCEQLGVENTGVVADTFHMNIEDPSIPDAIVRAGKWIWWVHLADSNRYALGSGHIDFKEVVKALKEINFQGYISLVAYPPIPGDLRTFSKTSIEYIKELERVADVHRNIEDTVLDWASKKR